MLICEFVFVILLFLNTISGGDYRCNAIEFWSSVVCSLENLKILNFHSVFDDSKSFTLLERCSEVFICGIARKCETTIVLKTHRFRDSRSTFYSANNDVVHETMIRSSIRKIIFEDMITFPAISSSIERISMQNGKKENTWNVHVILTRDIHFFDQISKNDSIFAWNPRDRYIMLIIRSNEHNQLNESDVRIDDVLKSLWSNRKMQSVFISEMMLENDTFRINRIIRTYNPFAKISDSVWGEIEIVNVKTAKQASNILSHLTYHRTKNLNGYELKVGLFKQGQSIMEMTKLQSSIASYYSDIFKGFDEIISNMITEFMNFKVKQIYSTDNKSYGYQLSNGTYVGAIGDVVHGRTDICFVTFFVKKYSANTNEDVEFSTYVEFDRVCVIVPKAPKIPKWLRIYHFFPLSVWICSMLSHVLTYLTWYFLQIFTLERTERTSLLAMIYRSFLLNAGCPQKLPNTNAERILLTGILLANVTLVGIFSGILYNSFAHDMYYPDIDSLRDLDASGLPISLASFSLTDLFGSSDDVNSIALMQNLRKKLQYGLNSIYNAAYYRNVSGFVREHHFPIISEEFIDADDGPLLHLVKECPGGYYLSYLLPRNSILHDRINALIGRLNQAGLPSFWNTRIIQAFVAQKRLLVKQKLVNEKKTNDFVPFNLSDVQSSFYMLLIGLLISTIVFFHETGWLKILFLHGKSNFKSIC